MCVRACACACVWMWVRERERENRHLINIPDERHSVRCAHYLTSWLTLVTTPSFELAATVCLTVICNVKTNHFRFWSRKVCPYVNLGSINTLKLQHKSEYREPGMSELLHNAGSVHWSLHRQRKQPKSTERTQYKHTKNYWELNHITGKGLFHNNLPGHNKFQ